VPHTQRVTDSPDEPREGFLASSRLRIERATEHLKSLSDHLATTQEAKPLTFSSHKELATGWKVIRLEILQEPPPRFGLLAGELLYQLRAALDNLVADLVVASGGHVTRDHCFPINVDEGQWTEPNVAKWLGGVDADWIAIIREYQPFAYRPETRQRHPLYGLARLNNADKHRAIPARAVLIGPGRVDITPTIPGSVEKVEVAWANQLTVMRTGGDVCRILTHPDPNSEVKVEINVNFPIGFGESGSIATVDDLRQLIPAIVGILDRFQPRA
jgi:hypothetical protein